MRNRAILVLLALPLLLPAGARAELSLDAAYQFTVARMATYEGAYRQALAAFAETVRLAPDEPYVRLEYARLLARLGRFAPTQEDQTRRLALASAQVLAATRVAPDNLEVLREAAQLHYLYLAERSPQSLLAAQEAFEKVRKAQPDDPRVLLPLGEIYLRQGQNAEAVDALRSAVYNAPGNGTAESLLQEALAKLAEQRLRAGRSLAAEELLEEILQENPGYVEIRQSLADLKSRRGESTAAVELLRPMAEEGDPEVGQRFAYELYRSGELRESLAWVDRLLAAGEEAGALSQLRVSLLATLGRSAEAAREGVALVTAEDGDADTIRRIANELVQSGQDEAALDLLAEVEGLFEARGDAASAGQQSLHRAQLLGARGEWADAEALLTRQVELRPEEGQAAEPTALAGALFLAEAMAQQERTPQALELLAAWEAGGRPVALKRAELLIRDGQEELGTSEVQAVVEEGDPESLFQAALLYQGLDRHADAIGLLQKVVEEREDSLLAHYNLAAAYERTGDVANAEKHLRTVVEQAPNYPPALNYLGYMWAERGENLEEALTLVHRAVSLDPSNGSYVDSLGWTHFQLGDYDAARQYLERAASLEPGDAVIHEHLGDVYEVLGEAEKARDIYRRALSLEGDNLDSLQRKLRELEESP